jgi:hypothetical protein
LNEEIKARWTAALRSGDYEQGFTLLQSKGKFCCLGVLCELAAADGIVTASENRGANGDSCVRYGGDNLDGSITSLPVAVQVWAGLPTADPYVEDPNDVDRVHSLTEWNDDMEVGFLEIADLIEASL